MGFSIFSHIFPCFSHIFLLLSSPPLPCGLSCCHFDGTWRAAPAPLVPELRMKWFRDILWMVAKSCTTWDGRKPINHGISTEKPPLTWCRISSIHRMYTHIHTYTCIPTGRTFAQSLIGVYLRCGLFGIY